MAKPRQCPECGAALPPEAPGGACPFCALREALAVPDEALEPGLTEKPGDRIGHYKLLEQIGEGGCGVVYMAEQTEPVRRRVALKIVKLGMDTKQVIARFEAERQALALMDHPNIAKIFDAGVTGTGAPLTPPLSPSEEERVPQAGAGSPPLRTPHSPLATHYGRPYFVMELVRGVRITDYCDQTQLDTKGRLDLFMQVCHAVQHAHQKGIIHRDLKPSNILVTLHDGVPVPKVIDFGIAKATQQPLTDKTVFTSFRQLIGTPAYMSPEQAELSGLDIDTRSDIYSLGVLLYELLTGRLPFEQKELAQAGVNEMRRMIQEQDPPKPSTRLSTLADAELSTTARQRRIEPPKLIKLVRGDLDWIVMRCLEKDRKRRYETADGLAQDVERHLIELPVEATPPSAAYRFGRFLKRNRLLAGSAALILATLIAATVVSLYLAVAAERAKRLATQERDKAVGAETRAEAAKRTEAEARRLTEETSARLQIQGASQVERDGPAATVAYLARLLRHNPSNRVAGARVLSTLAAKDFPFPVAELAETQGTPSCVAFSPDAERVVVGTREGRARIYRSQTGQPITEWLPHDAPVVGTRFSPDGKSLLTTTTNGARLWDPASGRALTGVLHPGGSLACARFSPEGELAATASGDKTVRFFNAATGQQAGAILQHPAGVTALEWSADGKRLVTGCADSTIWVWDTLSRQVQMGPLSTIAPVISLSLSMDGSQVLAGLAGQLVVLWDLERNQRRYLLRTVGSEFTEICNARFVPEPHAVWMVSRVAADKVKRARAARRNESGAEPDFPVGASKGNKERDASTLPPSGGEFSPDGQRLVVIGGDIEPALFSLGKDARIAAHEHLADWGPARFAQFSPDSLRLLLVSESNTVRVCFANSGALMLEPLTHAGRVTSAAFSRDGQFLVTASEEGEVLVWNLRLRHEIPTPISTTSKATLTELGPGGKRVAVASRDRSVHVWEVQNRHRLLSSFTNGGAPARLRFSPDERVLLTVSSNHAVCLWNTESGQPLHSGWRHEGPPLLAEFDPEGKRVLTVTAEAARWWDAASGKLISHLPLEPGDAEFAQFAPASQRLLTVSSNRADLWNLAAPRREKTWAVPEGRIHAARFSPAGDHVLAAAGKALRLWNTSGAGSDGLCLPHESEVLAADCSPDGKRLLTVSSPNVLRLWDLVANRDLAEPVRFRAALQTAQFSADGERILAIFADGVRLLTPTGELITSPFPSAGRLDCAQLSPDGRRLLAICEDGVARLWDSPFPPPPVPAWLPELAEAVVRQRLTQHGFTEHVPAGKFFEARKLATGGADRDYFTQWSRWYLAEQEQRTVSAASALKLAAFLEEEAHQPTASRVKNAVLFTPTNGFALAHWSRLALDKSLAAFEREPYRRDLAWCVNRAEELSPQEPEVWLARSRLLELSGESDQALAAHLHAAELAPASAEVWLDLANTELRLGSWPQARAHYLKVLELAPTNTFALHRLVWVMSAGPPELRDLPQALALAEKAAALHPGDPSSQCAFSLACYRSGKFQAAATHAEAAVAIASNSVPSAAWFLLAMSYQQLGQPTKARDAHQRGLSRWRTEPKTVFSWNDLFLEAETALRTSPITEHLRQVWDLSKDFSARTNPSGPWAYGWCAAGAWTNFSLFRTSGQDASFGIDHWYQGNGDPSLGRLAWGGAQLWPGQGPNTGLMAVVRWVAPYSGSFEVAAQFSGVESTGSTTVHLAVNGTVAYEESWQELGKVLAFKQKVSLQTGQTVDFAASKTAALSVNSPHTAVKATIIALGPEPPENPAAGR